MSTKTLGRDVEKEVHVATVVRHGDKITIPEVMSYDDAIDVIQRRKEYENQPVAIEEIFMAFPQDGAYAMDKVLTEMFGWTPAVGTGWFGQIPPKMLTVEIDFGKVAQVPWGKFSLPSVSGALFSGVAVKDGRVCFKLTASVLRRDEATIRDFFSRVRAYLKSNSIYKGKAVKIRFRDDNGSPVELPEPKFIDTSRINPNSLIYSKHVQDSVETNLFTPIQRVADCVNNDISVKRGVLLAGPYGTGKTLAAHVASKLAVENGLTYIYVERASELADAVNFAKLYSEPASVLFCEDIDRSVHVERTVSVDEILNIIDGVDSKHLNLITVLTTNHVENINAAMLRPGRLDAIIEVSSPDAEACERLLRWYGGESIDSHEDLSQAAKFLSDSQTIPATIAEVVKRAKLSQLRLQEPGTKVTKLSGDALTTAAFTMTSQNELLARASAPKDAPPTLDKALTDLVGVTVEKKLANQRLDADITLNGGDYTGTLEGTTRLIA